MRKTTLCLFLFAALVTAPGLTYASDQPLPRPMGGPEVTKSGAIHTPEPIQLPHPKAIDPNQPMPRSMGGPEVTRSGGINKPEITLPKEPKQPNLSDKPLPRSMGGPEAMQKRFNLLDTDHNGTISREEFSSSMPNMNKQAFDVMDTDHNGHLDQKEWENFRKSHGNHGGMPNMGKNPEKMSPDKMPPEMRKAMQKMHREQTPDSHNVLPPATKE